MSESGVKLEITIAVLNDGRVVFCDLPPDLAEVRDVLAGEELPTQTTCELRASDGLAAELARIVAPTNTATGDLPA
jgi:hypothetical protein